MINKWTLALAAAGVVSLPSLRAEEQHQVLTALSQTTLSGYVDTSASWMPGSPNGFLPGRTFDGADKQDGFNLNAVKLSLEKPLDEGQWSAGYKVDLIFGPDANYYGTILNGQNVTAGTGATGYNSDFAIKQAYVALRAPVGNGLDIKLGVFDTLIGYEVFESVNNPNFSRSYGYAIEPTHHTGLLLSYKVADWLSVSGGVANGWTGPVNDKIQSTAGVAQADSWESRKAYLGLLTITLPESTGGVAGSAIYLGIVHGENTGTLGGGASPEMTSYYAGLTLNTPIKALSFGASFDYRQNGPAFPAPSGDAWAAAGYVSFQATEKLKLNARADYIHAEDGTLFATGQFDSNGNVVGNFGQANQLGSLTATLDYSLWANVVTRGEVRWDHSFNSERPFGGSDLDKDAVTLTANLVYKF